MKKFGFYLLLLSIVLLNSCYVPINNFSGGQTDKPDEKNEDVSLDIKTSQSVKIPEDKSMTPVPGEQLFDSPDTVLYVSEIGQQFEVKNGQEVNFIYEDGIEPEETYFTYESTFDGYVLELHERNERVDVKFKRMCQIFIVANPNLTSVKVPKTLRYEQIIWTPRRDGTWEVRIGTTERGCKSKALRDLRELRDNNYEKSVPR
jgi:hypothetical protein